VVRLLSLSPKPPKGVKGSPSGLLIKKGDTPLDPRPFAFAQGRFENWRPTPDIKPTQPTHFSLADFTLSAVEATRSKVCSHPHRYRGSGDGKKMSRMEEGLS
jgi:hypothetical protein